jgi:hypothetical protein
VLVAVTAVIGVIIGYTASTVNGNAGGNATSAVRGDVIRGAAIVNDSQRLYAEDAGIAFQMAEAEIRSQVDSDHASSAEPALAADLRSDARIQTGIANALVMTSSWVHDPTTAPGIDGRDLLAHLAAIRARHPDLTNIDVAGLESAAEDDRRESVLLLAGLIPLAVAVLFGSLAEVEERRRDLLVACGWAATAIGVVFAVGVVALL